MQKLFIGILLTLTLSASTSAVTTGNCLILDSNATQVIENQVITINSLAYISDNLAAAFKAGNSTEIAKYFGNSVDLSIPNNEGVYSKVQAKLILKTFFLKNKPTDFEVVHSGDSKNNSHYSIGNLKTAKGLFRTYILYKKIDKKITILELKIESDD